MRRIAKPQINVRTVFTACISTVEASVLKQELTDCINTLEEGEHDFESKFITNDIYQIPQNSIVLGNIGKKQMKSVYDYRMVGVNMPGRKFYNQIKISAPHGKCPLCSVREVDTLDHYLPKSKYPLYAVTPINLIPACTPCNKGKHIDSPTTQAEQTLHPYFDSIDAESWLKAEVLQTNPIGFEYSVQPPASWPQILKDRTVNHFVAFNLNTLFISHANEEFRGSINQFINLYNNHPDLLKAHLLESYNSRLALGINSWQAVMYNALLNDIWFCSGGVII